jgi:hypothetical protein
MEELNKEQLLEEDLKKVESDALKKAMRHRMDEYLAIIIGVGSVLILWLLQEIGFY